ncbi:MAG: hypothetical protein JNN03_00795 [Rubrivivax sp.]|nr:hypothetical protein [Rubrivivax sp.]
MFNRDHLPDAGSYFEAAGLRLVGRGAWRTTKCEFHDGSDSMRANVRTGAWVCMACGVKGGDVLAYHMQRYGLDFVAAARALGAYVDDGKPSTPRDRPRRFSARDALEVIGPELGVCVVVVNDARRGIAPNERDWTRFLDAAGRIEAIAAEARK